jgi:hypothetical protein
MLLRDNYIVTDLSLALPPHKSIVRQCASVPTALKLFCSRGRSFNVSLKKTDALLK